MARRRYLTGFQDLTPVDTTIDAATIALAPKASTPAEAPVFGNVAAAPITSIASGTINQSPQSTPSPTVPAAFVNTSTLLPFASIPIRNSCSLDLDSIPWPYGCAGFAGEISAAILVIFVFNLLLQTTR